MTFASVSLIQRLMKLIDSHLVPEPFRSAIFDDKYEKGIDVVASATTIIKPVRVTKLRKEYFADMQESAVRRVSALLGTAVHNILEEYGEGLGWHVERRLYGVSKSGLSYSGQLDALIPNGDETWTIGDYKVVPTFKHNQLDEYFDQLNVQAALARQAGYDVTGLKVVAIFKDWMESRSKASDNYPPTPIVEYDVPMRDADELDDWIDSRLRQIVGDELPECSPEERWMRDDKWAVHKPKAKRATKVFDNKAEAESFLEVALKGKGHVDHRPATPIRCTNNYCGVAEWCAQWQEEKHLWNL